MPLGRFTFRRRTASPESKALQKERTLARRKTLSAEIKRVRTVASVQKDLIATQESLAAKKRALSDARISQFTTLNPDVRSIRQSRVIKLSMDVEALNEKIKALNAEFKLAKRADTLRRELAKNGEAFDDASVAPRKRTRKAT